VVTVSEDRDPIDADADSTDVIDPTDERDADPTDVPESATDPTEHSSDQPMSTDPIDATAATDQPDETTDDSADLVRYARYALLAGLTLLALVATFRFYFAVSNTIDSWVAREYRSLFQAAFNLVVLLVAAVGISWEIRKVTG
jgi:hypothetical protein